jgi:hypothetical protein
LDAQKRLQEKGKSDAQERTLFANILEQRRIVEEAARRSKERRQQERVPKAGTTAPSARRLVSAEESSDTIKPYPVEIWEPE